MCSRLRSLSHTQAQPAHRDSGTGSEEGSAHGGAPPGGGVDMSLSLGDVGALFFYVDSAGRSQPLLDVALRKGRMLVRSSQMKTSVDFLGELSTAVFTPVADTWEPVIEPWSVALSLQQLKPGAVMWRPAGTWLKADSRSELRVIVSNTLCMTLIDFLLESAKGQADGGNLLRTAATTPLVNTLGVPVHVRLGKDGKPQLLLPGEAMQVPLTELSALTRVSTMPAEARHAVIVDIAAVRGVAAKAGRAPIVCKARRALWDEEGGWGGICRAALA